MMPILVKSDDVREEERPRFVTGGYGRHRCRWVKQLDYELEISIAHRNRANDLIVLV